MSSCQSDPLPEYGPRLKKEYATRVPTVQKIAYSRQDTVYGYEMKVSYPAIQNNDAFNQLIQEKIRASREDFERFVADFDREARNELTADFELIHVTDSIVSIRHQYEWAVPGTSVLQYRFNNINFLPATNTSIGLEQLFRQGVDYRPLLSKLIKEKVKAEYELRLEEVTEATLQSFVVGKNYIEFYIVLYPEIMEPEPKAIRIAFEQIREELAW
jgi:hypothetical protein